MTKDNPPSTRPVLFKDLGKMDYKDAWDYQQKLHKEAIEIKLKNREVSSTQGLKKIPNHLLFVEHPHVYTLGKSGSINNLLLNEMQLKDNDIDYYQINRGGDITYHGPGQLVGYPILDLEQFFTDIHKYVRSLEEVVILTLAEYGIEAMRIPKYTGVWIDGSPKRKICAIGVHTSRWITLHGFAFNVNTDLSYFNHIIPCGIVDEDKTVTSMEKELGEKLDMNEVKDQLMVHFSRIFECQIKIG